MITLFGFGPLFQLPDPSPFVTKLEVLLKMSGLPYRWERGAPPASPKGKVPWIDDDGVILGDSTLIRGHLEQAYGIDFDAGLSAAQKAQAWAVERMLEDHLYFAILHLRWMNDANFAKGPAQFFAGAPDAVRTQARERARAYLHGHGLGRHSDAQIVQLAAMDLASLADLLGDKPYLMGDTPCGADATMFGMVSGVLTPFFDTPLRDAALTHANLVAYRDRMMEHHYPGFAKAAA
jgi:glutathione S-transferase